MGTSDTPAPDPRREADNVAEAEPREADPRDETIRLLNEALSRALDELSRRERPAA